MLIIAILIVICEVNRNYQQCLIIKGKRKKPLPDREGVFLKVLYICLDPEWAKHKSNRTDEFD